MNRTALSLAALFITASALFYLFGINAIFVLGLLLCVASGVCTVLARRKGIGFKPSLALLAGAVFCLLLNFYNTFNIEHAESLIGRTETVSCLVVEEPEYRDGYVRLMVETDGTNEFDKGLQGPVTLILNIDSDKSAYEAEAGDILSAEITFKLQEDSVRKYLWPDRVYVSTAVKSIEITGHKDTLYTYCIDLRKSIRAGIDSHVKGDKAALLKGLLLGDISGMSDELYADFKACGVSHVTAVSGMHIGAFCTMVTTMLGLFMSRRKAAAFAFVPLVITVMLAGVTPSAVRAGVMCGLTLLADCLLKKTDSLNSLGVAVSVMLLFNPLYVVNLGFQLSCSASAGVMVSAPYGSTLANRLAKTRFNLFNKIISAAVRIFVVSIGATVFTLPLQIVTFGYISVVAPLASSLICSAAVYAMAVTVVALVMYYIPYVEYIAAVPFWIAELLASYICVVVTVLADIPFSYIPFGDNSAILWVGLSLSMAAVWVLLNRTGGKRLAALLVTVLLLVCLWADSFASSDVIEVAVLETGNGLCTVITYGEKCVVIGCGNDLTDRYTLRNHLVLRSVSEVEMLLIPSDAETCFGGYEDILQEIAPKTTVIPDNFGNSTVFSGGVEVATDGSEYQANDGNIKIKALKCDNGCVYEVTCCEKRFFVSSSRYKAEHVGNKSADFIITSRALPYDINTELLIVSSETEIDIENCKTVLTTAGRTISVKLKPNKGVTVYEGYS